MRPALSATMGGDDTDGSDGTPGGTRTGAAPSQSPLSMDILILAALYLAVQIDTSVRTMPCAVPPRALPPKNDPSGSHELLGVWVALMSRL